MFLLRLSDVVGQTDCIRWSVHTLIVLNLIRNKIKHDGTQFFYIFVVSL